MSSPFRPTREKEKKSPTREKEKKKKNKNKNKKKKPKLQDKAPPVPPEVPVVISQPTQPTEYLSEFLFMDVIPSSLVTNPDPAV